MLKTRHNVYFCDARRMQMLPSASVDLIVTSPPYPMIQMWDAAFCQQDPRIADALAEGRRRGLDLPIPEDQPVAACKHPAGSHSLPTAQIICKQKLLS